MGTLTTKSYCWAALRQWWDLENMHGDFSQSCSDLQLLKTLHRWFFAELWMWHTLMLIISTPCFRILNGLIFLAANPLVWPTEHIFSCSSLIYMVCCLSKIGLVCLPTSCSSFRLVQTQSKTCGSNQTNWTGSSSHPIWWEPHSSFALVADRKFSNLWQIKRLVSSSTFQGQTWIYKQQRCLLEVWVEENVSNIQ